MPLYFTSATNTPVSLPELLNSRDTRQTRQQQWLAQYALPLISFTVLAPGAVKDSELTRRIFNHGLRALRLLLEEFDWEIKQQHCTASKTGAEGLLAVNAPAHRLKQATIKLEQNHPLGRLWDIDVLTPEGKILSRSDFSLPARPCLLCSSMAAVCAREHTHSITDLHTRMEALLHDVDNTAYA